MSLREKKAVRKKQEMIRSAIAIIGEKGYHATTMEDIAAKLLMTKGSVYYYFKDKKDLVYQSQKMLLEQGISNMERVFNEDLDIISKLTKIMVVHMEYLIKERTGFAMGATPEQFFDGAQLEVIVQLRKKYGEYIDLMIMAGIKAHIFVETDIKITRNIILGAMNWVIAWYSPEGQMGKTELAEKIADYLLKILLNKQHITN